MLIGRIRLDLLYDRMSHSGTVNNGHLRDRLKWPLFTDDCYTQVDYNVETRRQGPSRNRDRSNVAVIDRFDCSNYR